MSAIDRQVGAAQARLNINVLMAWLSAGVAIAALTWAVVWTAQRLFALGVPLWPSVAGAAGLAVVVTVVGLLLQRVGQMQAALALDHAAGLKQRVSTAIEVRQSDDPFVGAAVRDAETTAARIHVASHIPYKTPQLLSWSVALVVMAVLLGYFLPQMDLLASTKPKIDPDEANRQLQERTEIKTRVDEKLNQIREFAKEKPELGELAKDLQPLAMPEKPSQAPDDVRREALKQIDKVTDKLEQKLEDTRLAALDDMKKMLSKLDQQTGDKQDSTKLEKALLEGDMAAAKQAMDEIKHDIQEAAKKADPEARKQLEQAARQLEQTAKKISEAADQKALQKELQNKAGMTPEQAKKLLDEMKKMDPKEMKKALEEQLQKTNMTPQQMQEMAKKISENKEAQQEMKKMAEKLSQAAAACKNAAQQEGAKSEEAAQQAGQNMDNAAEQMSEMEMAQEMMNEMEAQLQELKDLRAGVCEGNGQKPGEGEPKDQIGGQGPQAGLGYGAHTGKEKAAHNMTPSKVKGVNNKGEIIGQVLVDGPQLRGEARAAVRDAVQSAVRDATDAVAKQQVPQQYSRAVREYFEQLAGLAGGDAAEKPLNSADAKSATSDDQSGDQ
ncbi:MAG: hypothetical protein JNG88_06825 [Phycisphaerales bacterium]|nr:hypothetical protein [Phycisphaerales bacterium]